MRKAKVFMNNEQYENWTKKFENLSDCSNIPVLIMENNKMSADCFFQCKSWKTALRRFKKAFNNQLINQWVDLIYDSCESGCFKDGFSGDVMHYYSWGVEQYDEEWYIFINTCGVYSL